MSSFLQSMRRLTKRVEPTSTARSGRGLFSAISFILGLSAVAVAHPRRWRLYENHQDIAAFESAHARW
jgi:hypothetical protein